MLQQFSLKRCGCNSVRGKTVEWTFEAEICKLAGQTDFRAGLVAYNFYPYSTAPAPYDLVWSRFPNVEEPDLPGPKARPALVRQAFQDSDGNAWVKVVYGTSKSPYKADIRDFSVVTLPEMNACGLRCATRFHLNRPGIAGGDLV